MRSSQISKNVGSLSKWCISTGPHPDHLDEEGWQMSFKFPNGLQANVIWGEWSRGIEVEIRDAISTIDAKDDLGGDDVLSMLTEIMQRSSP